MEKMLGDDFKPFSCRSAGGKEWLVPRFGNFNSHRAILEEENLPEVPKKGSIIGSKYQKQKPKGAFEHDVAFKPSGCKFKKIDTMTDFIGKFPEYVCAAPKEKGRRVFEEKDYRDWRVTSKEWTGPTPSVALNTRNLKSSFPSAFKK